MHASTIEPRNVAIYSLEGSRMTEWGSVFVGVEPVRVDQARSTRRVRLMTLATQSHVLGPTWCAACVP